MHAYTHMHYRTGKFDLRESRELTGADSKESSSIYWEGSFFRRNSRDLHVSCVSCVLHVCMHMCLCVCVCVFMNIKGAFFVEAAGI